jgi:hypothetical protein
MAAPVGLPVLDHFAALSGGVMNPTGLNALNAMHRETRNELGVYGLPTSAMMLARTVTLSPLGSRWSMTETETGSTRFATVPGETPEVSLCSPAA